VDPRAGLDDVEKRKFYPHRDLNSDPSVVQPVASRYTYYAIEKIKMERIWKEGVVAYFQLLYRPLTRGTGNSH
jgi:hypothetical protein